MKVTLFILLFSFCLGKAFSQQPAHFIWGEDDLDGVEIYGLHHGLLGQYWVASDRGVYYHDGYSFHHLNCEEMIGSSVFNLVEDSRGNVFCSNLSGQIFKMSLTGCEMVYQIADSLLGPDLSMIIDNQDRLIIATRTLLTLSTSQGRYKLENIESRFPYYYGVFELTDGSVIVSSHDGDILQMISNKWECKYLKNKDETVKNPLRFFYFKNDLYAFDNDEMNYKQLDTNLFPKVTFTPNYIKDKSFTRIYSSNEELWVSDLSTGMQKVDYNLINAQDKIFGKKFISTHCTDRNGNTLFGTFGEGIVVISNHFAFEENSFSPEKIKRITKTESGNIFLGSENGKVYQIDTLNNRSTFINKGKRNVEILYNLESIKKLLIGQRKMMLFDINDHKSEVLIDASIKDVFPIYKDEYLIGTSIGGFYYDPSMRRSLHSKGFELKEYNTNFYKIIGTDSRVHSIGYDSLLNILFTGSSNGLSLIGGKEEHTEFKLNGKRVSASDILFVNDKIYIATQKKGVLIFENGQLIDQWTTDSGLVSNHVTQIKAKENNLFIATQEGLQIVNEKGETINILDESLGIYSSNIIDFEVVKDKLWIVHNRSLQFINLRDIESINFVPKIKINSIKINDQKLIDWSQSKFNYDQRKITFELYSFDLQHYKNIKYKYQLIGAEEEYQFNKHADNTIEYKSLSPGKYTFRVSAIWRDKESETIEYDFEITSPFWLSWWFYLIIAVSLTVLSFIYFRYRLIEHRKKSNQLNELNSSKLTAIQSQMNPHFIFNALNSIQDLVLKGDVDNSYTYITKFANLVRRTLNYSDKDFIEFESEIKLIELYLTLEKLRFKSEFEYEINTNDIDDVLVPPMLIQPFIENSLLHGLLHKEGRKVIVINFELNDELICTIEDNGVGRKKAGEIKERQRAEHESFSINAIKKRFEILEEHFGGSLGFVYEDLYKGEESVGTRVILKIPIKRTL